MRIVPQCGNNRNRTAAFRGLVVLRWWAIEPNKSGKLN